MKAKRIFLPALLAALSALSGCAVRVHNATPATIPTNPSGIYTISAQAMLDSEAVDRSSIKAYIVIDGETHPMTPSDLGNGYFDYDYAIPKGREKARYYYYMDYKLKSLNDAPKTRRKYSEKFEVSLINRFSITLDTNRAPVGTQLAVLGRGFSRGDTVFVGGVQADTRYSSANTLQFIVPSVDPGQTYTVEVRGKSVETAGTLKVDPGLPLSVIPTSLTLDQGQRQALAFAIDYAAPAGGLYLNVTTDIPNSIIMPEVIVPEGARTVSVTVQGGKPGSGSLFVQAAGMTELVIPVTVR